MYLDMKGGSRMYDRELVKGSTSLLLLHLVSKRPMYGYEMAKEMEKKSNRELTIKEGTLYPALHKLEQKGFIESFWQQQTGMPARKYYRVTAEGEALLREKKREWRSFVSVIDRVLGEST